MEEDEKYLWWGWWERSERGGREEEEGRDASGGGCGPLLASWGTESLSGRARGGFGALRGHLWGCRRAWRG